MQHLYPLLVAVGSQHRCHINIKWCLAFFNLKIKKKHVFIYFPKISNLSINFKNKI